MSSLVSIRTNLKDVERTLNKVQRQVLPQAVATAINKTLKNVEVQGVRKLSQETGLRQKSIRDRLKRHNATRSRLTGELVIFEKRWPNIASFEGRQTKRGVSSRAWGKRKVYKGTFLINGGLVAVARETKARYPLKKVWGPSIVRVFESTTVARLMQETADARFLANLDHELRFRLGRLR